MEKVLKAGESCGHSGCLNHATHPCEGCGRLRGGIDESQEKEEKENTGSAGSTGEQWEQLDWEFCG